MIKSNRYSNLIFGLTQFVFLPKAYAQGRPAAVTNTRSLIDNVICPVFDAMFYILMAISVIMVMWAAYLYVFAQEDTERTSKARRTITYAALAIVVALLAKGFPILVSSVFPALAGGITGCP